MKHVWPIQLRIAVLDHLLIISLGLFVNWVVHGRLHFGSFQVHVGLNLQIGLIRRTLLTAHFRNSLNTAIVVPLKVLVPEQLLLFLILAECDLPLEIFNLILECDLLSQLGQLVLSVSGNLGCLGDDCLAAFRRQNAAHFVG